MKIKAANREGKKLYRYANTFLGEAVELAPFKGLANSIGLFRINRIVETVKVKHERIIY
jgi:hypothetical protein